MANWIFQYWLQCLFGVIVTGLTIGFKNMEKLTKKTIKEIEANKIGTQALLRDRIKQSYNFHKRNGFCPIHEREDIELLFKQYKTLGGNGTLSHLVDEIMDMKTAPEEEK